MGDRLESRNADLGFDASVGGVGSDGRCWRSQFAWIEQCGVGRRLVFKRGLGQLGEEHEYAESLKFYLHLLSKVLLSLRCGMTPIWQDCPIKTARLQIPKIAGRFE